MVIMACLGPFIDVLLGYNVYYQRGEEREGIKSEKWGIK
jgi:hypothetical protein